MDGGSLMNLLEQARSPVQLIAAVPLEKEVEFSTQHLRKKFKPRIPSAEYHNNCDKFQYNARKKLLLRLKRLKDSYRTIETNNGRIYYFCEHTGETIWDIGPSARVVPDIDEFPTLEKYKQLQKEKL